MVTYNCFTLHSHAFTETRKVSSHCTVSPYRRQSMFSVHTYHMLYELLNPVTLYGLMRSSAYFPYICLSLTTVVNRFEACTPSRFLLTWFGLTNGGKTLSIVSLNMSSIMRGKSISSNFELSSRQGFVLTSINQHRNSSSSM